MTKYRYFLKRKISFVISALNHLGVTQTLRLELHKRLPLASKFTLTSPYLRFPVFARSGTSDTSVFSQIFVYRQYAWVDDLNLDGLIVDLGANIGYAAAYFLSRFSTASILAVEPDHENYQMLMQNLEPYRGRFSAIEAAIWPRKDRLKLTAPSAKRGEEWGRQVEPSSEGAIIAVTMADILQIAGDKKISLLKIDIEGAERELFRTGAEHWLSQVDHLAIELHGPEATKIFDDAMSPFSYSRSTFGDMTICRDIRKKMVP